MVVTLLWLPTRPLLSSLEADALEDLDPPEPPPTDPWTEHPMTTTTRRHGLDLDEVVFLLRSGDTIETVARRLGIDEASIVTAARRKGTPDQRARIAQASEAMRDIHVALAS